MNNQRDPIRVLITGAGGAAAIAFMRAIEDQPHVTIHMCDMDPHAQGLYLVPQPNRHLVPAGASADFVTSVLQHCRQHRIDVLVPTVDCELSKIARQKRCFAEAGIEVICADQRAIDTCCDKYRLMRVLSGHTPAIGWFRRFDENFKLPNSWYPFILKPRFGSGGRDVHLIRCPADLEQVPRDGSFFAQEYLPGPEYSVDTYCNKAHQAIACVVRERIKVDSGVAVVSRTVAEPQIVAFARHIARVVGLRFAANLQFKLDPQGRPKLLEINPRFPGTMSLTVAAGVNMPALSLREAARLPLADHYDYQLIAMVRSWQEKFLPADELMQQSSDDCAGWAA